MTSLVEKYAHLHVSAFCDCLSGETLALQLGSFVVSFEAKAWSTNGIFCREILF